MFEFKEKTNRNAVKNAFRANGHVRSTLNSSINSKQFYPQQIPGNQAILRFAASCPLKLPASSMCPLGGACHTCPVSIQKKLKISKPGDKYEQEADNAAELVMKMQEPEAEEQITYTDQPDKTNVLRSCSKCNEQSRFLPFNEEDELLTKTEINSRRDAEIYPDLSSRILKIKGSGRPLTKSERTFFEPRFGYDFSRVKIHTDNHSDETAHELNARAFTIGSDIVFRKGEYRPGTIEGRKLLAHELAHVIQQSAGESILSSKQYSNLNQIQPTANEVFHNRTGTERTSLIKRDSFKEKNLFSKTGKMVAGLWGSRCLSQKIAYWAAFAAAIAACGGAIITSETGIGLVLLGIACVAAIAAYIGAIVALKECMETDPDADRREIERLRQEQRRMERRLRQVERMTGSRSRTEGSSGGSTGRGGE